MQYIVIALTFVAGFLLVFGVNLLLADIFAAHRRRVRRRLAEKMLLRQKERANDALADQELYDLASAGLEEFRRKVTLRAWVAKLLEESGWTMRPRELLGLLLTSGLVAGLLAWMFSHNGIASGMTAAIAASLPLLYLLRLRMRRREKILSQLPDAFDLIARTLRSGQTISHGLQGVAEDLSPPISTEFGYCYDQQELGLSAEVAMRDLAERVGLLELRIFFLVVMVHRQTGGNLAELLENLSSVIRDRYRIRGAVKALTAEGRLQGTILLVLPPALLCVMFLMNRSYILVLFQYPALLITMGCSMLFGALWIRRIVHFDF
jgi:tight adherence protein B